MTGWGSLHNDLKAILHIMTTANPPWTARQGTIDV